MLLYRLDYQMSLQTPTRVKRLDMRKWRSALVHAETSTTVYSATGKTMNAGNISGMFIVL